MYLISKHKNEKTSLFHKMGLADNGPNSGENPGETECRHPGMVKVKKTKKKTTISFYSIRV